MPPNDATWADRFLALALGGLFGAAALGYIGSVTGREAVAGGVGAALGGLVGWGSVVGRISPITVCACVFGVLGCALGPGVDDYGGQIGMILAAVGAAVGALGWRRPRWFWLGLHPWDQGTKAK